MTNTTQQTDRKFKAGDKVECNGNKEGVVICYPYCDSLVDVRLWDGLRLIGNVCVSESDLKAV